MDHAPTARGTGVVRPPAAYYPLFDWLRIVLASVVVLHHAGAWAWPKAGNLAVQVFFALSGWLIGGILLETPPAALPRFWFQRATRIWIPYGVTLAAILGLGLLRDELSPAWLRAAAAYLTMTYNWFGYAAVEAGDAIRLAHPLQGSGHPLWSIGVEEQFYLAAPLLLVVLPRRIGRAPLLWMAVAGGALAAGHFGAIALGVLAAVARARAGDWHLQLAGAAAAAAGAAAGILGLLLGAPYQLAAPVVAVSVVLLLARPGARSPAGAFLGGVSYPLYLTHWLGGFLAHAALRPLGLRHSVVAEPLSVLTAFALALAFYLAVDRQVLARRSTWYTPRLGWALGATGFLMLAAGLAVGLT